ncbi:MAG: hypothetical protein DI637_08835 [Citromicrobium sp.]|nr:MAG: hypothetical protein DI637_08835 [Citromicrobium sp.]
MAKCHGVSCQLPAAEDEPIHRVIAIDDHELAHSGIRLLLSGHAEYELVATFTRARDAIDFLDDQPGMLVVLDLELPDLDGLSAAGEIIGRSLGKVVLLTGVTDSAALRQAVALGVSALVCKGDPIGDVLMALDAAVGGRFYQSRTAALLVEQGDETEVALTSRQSAILQLLASGCTNKEIAYRMEISAPTVSYHLGEIRRRLATGNNRQLVEAARARGLLP